MKIPKIYVESALEMLKYSNYSGAISKLCQAVWILSGVVKRISDRPMTKPAFKVSLPTAPKSKRKRWENITHQALDKALRKEFPILKEYYLAARIQSPAYRKAMAELLRRK